MIDINKYVATAMISAWEQELEALAESVLDCALAEVKEAYGKSDDYAVIYSNVAYDTKKIILSRKAMSKLADLLKSLGYDAEVYNYSGDEIIVYFVNRDECDVDILIY